MKASRFRFATVALLAIAVAAATLATPAMADRGHGRGKANGHYKARYKGVERVVVAPRPHHVVYVQPRVREVVVGSSFANLVLAGVIGGVQVSAQFGDAPYRGYGYWDPYCDVRFSDLGAYRHHCGAHRHPYRLRVFAVAPGHVCDRYCDHGCDDRTWDRDDHRYDDRNYDRYDGRDNEQDDEDWNR